MNHHFNTSAGGGGKQLRKSQKVKTKEVSTRGNISNFQHQDLASSWSIYIQEGTRNFLKLLFGRKVHVKKFVIPELMKTLMDLFTWGKMLSL